jgi:hypothetical protein
VVFGHRVRPLTKPRGKRCGEFRTLEGMIPNLFPLSVVKCAGLVQDIRVDRDLSNVVQKCRPTKSIPIDLWQLHFLGDEVGVHSHALTVAASEAIMDVERTGQHENLFSCDDGRITHPVVFRLLHSSSQVPGTSRLARNGHSLRGLVWENQCHFQQHGQREQSTRHPISYCQHDKWCAKNQNPPSNRHGGTVWFGQCASDDGRSDDGKANRSQERCGAHER